MSKNVGSKDMKGKVNSGIIAFCVILCAAMFFFIYLNENGFFEPKVDKVDTVFTTKTDTIFKTDTFIRKKLVPKEVIKERVDTVFDKDSNLVELITEHKRYQDTIINGVDTAEVNIYTSGIRTSVDSLQLKLNRHIVTTTNTIEVTKYIKDKPKIIHFSPNISGGYGIINKQFDIYVGWGVTIDI